MLTQPQQRPEMPRPNAPLERLLGVAIVVAALLTIPLTAGEELGINPEIVLLGDWVIWSIFFGEFVIMATVSRNPLGYARHHILDLAVVIITFPLLPHLLALARLARLFRLVRLLLVSARAFGALRVALGRPGLLYIAVTALLLIVTGGGLLAVLEPETVKETGIMGGIWWAVVTVTTVGYGDIAPTTAMGRLLGIALMFVGIGLVSTLAASVAAYFVDQDGARERIAQQERLARLESKVDRLLEAADDTQRQQR